MNNTHVIIMRTREKRRNGDDSPFLIQHEMNAYFALLIEKCSNHDLRKKIDRILFKSCPRIIYMKPPAGVDMTDLMFGCRYKSDQANCLVSMKTFVNKLSKDESVLIIKQLYNMVAGISYFDTDGEEIPEEKRQEFIPINKIKLMFSCKDYRIRKVNQKQLKDAFANLDFTYNNLITKEIKRDFENIFKFSFGSYDMGAAICVFINPLDEMPEHSIIYNDEYSLDNSIFGKYYKRVRSLDKDTLINEIEFRELFSGLFISGESGTKHVVENLRGTPGDVFITGDPEMCESKHEVDVTGAVNITFSWNARMLAEKYRHSYLFNNYGGQEYNGCFIGIPMATKGKQSSTTIPDRYYIDEYSTGW